MANERIVRCPARAASHVCVFVCVCSVFCCPRRFLCLPDSVLAIFSTMRVYFPSPNVRNFRPNFGSLPVTVPPLTLVNGQVTSSAVIFLLWRRNVH